MLNAILILLVYELYRL